MAKTIIYIHGRANKPEKKTLKQWWTQSIQEGLEHNETIPLGHRNIRMAYYADIFYDDYKEKGPVPDSENKEPYQPALPGAICAYEKRAVDRIRKIAGDWLDKPFDWLEEHSNFFSALGREVSKKVLKDLGEYYSDNTVRTSVNNRLKDLLIKHRKDEIILISHSMGTIVAYDVLRELGSKSDHPNFAVEHFVTMGSPLGMTVVKGNSLHTYGRLRTPSCVKKTWVNFSDPQDIVCADSHLSDEYFSNSSSVKVKDVMVCNDYPNNEHKSYGYLRTPEFSKHLASLL